MMVTTALVICIFSCLLVAASYLWAKSPRTDWKVRFPGWLAHTRDCPQRISAVVGTSTLDRDSEACLSLSSSSEFAVAFLRDGQLLRCFVCCRYCCFACCDCGDFASSWLASEVILRGTFERTGATGNFPLMFPVESGDVASASFVLLFTMSGCSPSKSSSSKLSSKSSSTDIETTDATWSILFQGCSQLSWCWCCRRWWFMGCLW